MQHNQQPNQHDQDTLQRGILDPALRLLAMAAVSVAVGHGESAEATTLPSKNKSVEPSAHFLNRTDEQLNRFTPEAANDIRANTLYIKGLNCSGRALRNRSGEIIGAITAEHCSLRGSSNQRYTGSDGQRYMVQSEPVKALTGRDIKHPTSVTILDKYVLPAANDSTHDIALAVAKGYTSKEVTRAYEREALTPEQTRRLKPGTAIRLSGWPVKQSSNIGKELRRQSFKMNVIGTGFSNTTMGENLEVLWAVMGKNDRDNNAECSFGNSGASAGIDYRNGHHKTIGTEAVFVDFTGGFGNSKMGPLEIKKQLKDLDLPVNAVEDFEKEHGKAVALCGFAFNVDPAGEVVSSVSSQDEIPGHMSPETATKNALHDFFDPTQPRYAIEGRATLFERKGGGNGPLTIDNPVLIHYTEAGITMVMSALDSEPDNLSAVLFQDDSLPSINLRSKDGNTDVSLRELQGVPVYEPSTDATSNGDFQFADDFEAGRNLINSEPQSTKATTLQVAKDGSYVLSDAPVSMKGGG